MKDSELNLDPFPELGPTFCVLPWLHLMVGTSGAIHPCCTNPRRAVDEMSSPSKAGRDTLASAWNSGFFRSLRQDMLAGRRAPGCDTCYAAEATGRFSYRQGANFHWAQNSRELVLRLVEESRNGGGVRDFPRYLDLRLERTCNLGCRSCNPASSSFLGREWRSLPGDIPAFRELWDPGAEPADPSPAERKALLAEVRGQLRGIRRLYLTGGEPMLVRGNQELLEACVEEGVAGEIELMLNTNLTTHNKAFYGLFHRFKSVQVNCSLDGYGPLNEYLRYPSRWERVDTNLRELLRMEGPIAVTATFVAQFHNVLQCTELFEYLDGLNTLGKEHRRPVGLDIIHLENPSWLRYSLLPPELRSEAAARLGRFMARSFLYARDFRARKSLDALEAALRQESPEEPEESGELLERNRSYTHSLDRHRGMRLEAMIPELAAFA